MVCSDKLGHSPRRKCNLLQQRTRQARSERALRIGKPPYRELNLIIRELPRGLGEPALAVTLPSPSISPSEWLAVAGSSIRAVASVVEGDVLHQADEDLGRTLVLAGPIVKL
jgi:hypothetical protein